MSAFTVIIRSDDHIPVAAFKLTDPIFITKYDRVIMEKLGRQVIDGIYEIIRQQEVIDEHSSDS